MAENRLPWSGPHAPLVMIPEREAQERKRRAVSSVYATLDAHRHAYIQDAIRRARRQERARPTPMRGYFTGLLVGLATGALWGAAVVLRVFG